MLKNLLLIAIAGLCLSRSYRNLYAQSVPEPCPRPLPGSTVGEPEDLRSRNGVLKVEFTIHNSKQSDGSTRYCYIDANGRESPTLRVNPGDLVILTLKNALTNLGPGGVTTGHEHMHGDHEKSENSCPSGQMSPTSTNMHFHGLTIPPVCHQDDVLKTSIQPGDPPFEYRFHIPGNQPPGLYWYHPHLHGLTKQQILGGASGALIVEGIERADRALAGLPERVLIIRDQDLLNPNAPPSKSEPVLPKMLFDRDGDAANTGTGFGKPAKDISINFVPVPYPDYPPASIGMKPDEQQLWRVVNASEITYLNLELLIGHTPQPLGLVALDGVPLNENGMAGDFVDWQTHLGVPPGARVEFIAKAPPAGVWTFGHANRRYWSGWRERSQPGDCHNHDFQRCTRTTLATRRLAEAASSFRAALAGKRGPRAHPKALLFREAFRTEQPQQCDRILHYGRGPDAGTVRPQIRGSEYHCETGNRRGLDHREPVQRTACVPYSSAAFHAARLPPQDCERAVSSRYR